MKITITNGSSSIIYEEQRELNQYYTVTNGDDTVDRIIRLICNMIDGLVKLNPPTKSTTP